ncbi:hypothetical protein PVT71_13650 [Salipiger sp. H15]|uniref:Phage tail protein n=1 Tax=Alloyangia sp. H15 TaxID=3029062 RepID=A0AAU8AH47_9RHOB
MAWTQADVDTIKAAIARGVTRVRLNGEEVQYRTLEEMKSTLRMMEDEVSGRATGAFRVSYPRASRGL